MRRMIAARAGEDLDDVRAAADILVQRLLRVVRPDLPPDLPRERGDGQQFVAGVIEVFGGCRQPLRDRGHRPLVLGADAVGVGLVEDGAHQGGDPSLCCLGDLVSRLP
jgi:hypothetical protein